ncbi:hypothetical protein P9112_001730 [Eukaryota sp. TZLM1-RC]
MSSNGDSVRLTFTPHPKATQVRLSGEALGDERPRGLINKQRIAVCATRLAQLFTLQRPSSSRCLRTDVPSLGRVLLTTLSLFCRHARAGLFHHRVHQAAVLEAQRFTHSYYSSFVSATARRFAEAHCRLLTEGPFEKTCLVSPRELCHMLCERKQTNPHASSSKNHGGQLLVSPYRYFGLSWDRYPEYSVATDGVSLPFAFSLTGFFKQTHKRRTKTEMKEAQAADKVQDFHCAQIKRSKTM